MTADDKEQFGFGLIIAKQTIEAFGGQIDFNSEPGLGTTFVFSFEIELYENGEKGGKDSPKFGMNKNKGDIVKSEAEVA